MIGQTSMSVRTCFHLIPILRPTLDRFTAVASPESTLLHTMDVYIQVMALLQLFYKFRPRVEMKFVL